MTLIILKMKWPNFEKLYNNLCQNYLYFIFLNVENKKNRILDLRRQQMKRFRSSHEISCLLHNLCYCVAHCFFTLSFWFSHCPIHQAFSTLYLFHLQWRRTFLIQVKNEQRCLIQKDVVYYRQTCSKLHKCYMQQVPKYAC